MTSSSLPRRELGSVQAKDKRSLDPANAPGDAAKSTSNAIEEGKSNRLTTGGLLAKNFTTEQLWGIHESIAQRFLPCPLTSVGRWSDT